MTFGDWAGEAGNWVFAVLSLIMLFAAVRVVTSRNVVHAVLFLVATLGGSAAVFLLLGAEFVAWTVVLISIGAVIVLFLFGIMITRAPLGYETELDHPNRWPAVVVAASVFALMAGSTLALFEDVEVKESVVRSSDIGTSIFERYVIPFEVVSFLLLAALIGGIVLARRDREEEPAP